MEKPEKKDRLCYIDFFNKSLSSFLLLGLVLISSVKSSPLPSKDIQQLVIDAEIGHYSLRIASIISCGLDRIHPCYRVLVRNLNDKDIEVRNSSARSLAYLRPKEALPHIKKAIQVITEEIQTKKKLVETRKQYPAQKNELIEKEKELKKFYFTKANMIWAIGAIQEKSELPFLIEFLKDENGIIRSTAALGISYMADLKHQETLEGFLNNEKEEEVRIQIARTLLMINPFERKYIEAMIKLLSSENKVVRKKVAEVIIQFRIKEARNPLERAIQLEEDDEVRRKLYKAHTYSILY